MPRSSTNSTISSGTCAAYASGGMRSCYDCLNFIVTAAPEGCTINMYGACISKASSVSTDSIAFVVSTSAYCEASDPMCKSCLSVSTLDVCHGVTGCVCVRQCENISSSYTSGAIFNSSSAFDDSVSDMHSDFNRTRNIMLGIFGGFVALIILCSCCCWRRHARARKNAPVMYASAYEPRGDGFPARSPGGQPFGHSAATPGSYDRYDGSGIPYAQAVDTTSYFHSVDMTPSATSFSCTSDMNPPAPSFSHSSDMAPSAPAFESSSSASAPTSY